jgi:methionine-rich copper-binding protein CopC
MTRKSSLLTAALAAAVFVLSPAAAFAHDQVVNTSPSANSTVQAGVIDVSVTFNEDIMATQDNSGEVIEVVGPDGGNSTTWSNGCVTVDGSTESTQVDLDQPGTYTVNWRSVSNDGHPNDGSFTFNVTNDSNYQSSGLVEPSAECASASPDATLYETKTLGEPDPYATETPVMLVSTNEAPKADPFITNLPYLFAGLALIFLGAIAGPLVQKIRASNAAKKAKRKAELDKED